MKNASRSALVLILLALFAVPVSAVTLGISADGRFFTFDGVPTYLNGISYYGGCQISSQSMVTQDLNDMQARGINWLRVWTFWNFNGQYAAPVTDLNGNVQEPYMSRLKYIIQQANNRGMIVDVTMSRNSSQSTIAQYTQCARTIATELLPYRNVYIDVGNERDVGDSRYISIPDCGNIINAIKAIDPNRICTASGVPANQSDLDYFLTTGHLDFIAPHLCRSQGCSAQTYGTVRTYVTWMTNLGKRVPVHLQEPFRRGYTSYNPVQEDYYRDNSGAKAAEAAGWCFHNGSNPTPPPYRSFLMNDTTGRLFSQIDSIEVDALANIYDTIGGNSWKVRRYQVEYTEQIPHQTGRKEGLFWSANVAQDSAAFLTYGPYLNGIAAGSYRVSWRLMIDDNTSNNDTVATLDVYSGGVRLAQREIHRQEFTAANTWKTFSLDFTSAGQQNLEFRTYWPDNCYLKVDHITLNTDAAPDWITGLASVGTDGQVALSWTNPPSSNYTGTMIRWSTAGYPLSPTDGTLLCDRAASPGSNDNYTHTGITGSMYYYAAYARDSSAHYSQVQYTSGSPHTVTNTVYDNGGNPWPIPGKIEAEYYDNGGEGVAYHTIVGTEPPHTFRPTETVYTESCGDTGGTYNIGAIDSGEWWKYTVNVGSTAAYTMDMRVASPYGGQYRIEVDTVDVTGVQSVPITGAWQTYTTVQSAPVLLTAGNHIIRVYVIAGAWNFNYLNVSTSSCIAPSITSQPTGQTTCVGTTTTFTLNTTGTGLIYQWRKNGVSISNGATGNGSSYANCTTNTLSITNTQMADGVAAANGFDCVITGTCGTVTSNRVGLSVSLCQGVTIQRGVYGTVKDTVLEAGLVANGSDANRVDLNMGAGGSSRMYPDVGAPSTKNARHFLYHFDTSGIPTGSTIQSATFGVYIYNGSNAPTITGYKLSRLRAGREWIEGTGAESLALAGEPTWHCRASAGGAFPQNCNLNWTAQGCSDTTFDIDNTTTKTWDQTSGTANGYKTFDITSWVNDWVNNSGTWPNNGMMIWGGVGPGGSNYYWATYLSENGSNTPYLSVSYVLSCDPPTITAQPASLVKMAGGSASFNVTANGTGLAYQWKKGGSTIGGANSSSYAINPVSASDSANYTCLVTGTCGSVGSNTAALTVLTNPGSIAAAKASANGSPVHLGNKDLYLKWTSAGFGYIEEPLQFAGVRVQGSLTATQGDRVCLVGTMQKPVGAEPYIQVTTMTPATGPTVEPVAAGNFALYSDIIDGLWVLAYGRVVPGSITSNSYVLSDGDGGPGVKVITQGAPGVTENAFVWLTGAAGWDAGRVIYKR